MFPLAGSGLDVIHSAEYVARLPDCHMSLSTRSQVPISSQYVSPQDGLVFVQLNVVWLPESAEPFAGVVIVSRLVP